MALASTNLAPVAGPALQWEGLELGQGLRLESSFLKRAELCRDALKPSGQSHGGAAASAPPFTCMLPSGYISLPFADASFLLLNSKHQLDLVSLGFGFVLGFFQHLN